MISASLCGSRDWRADREVSQCRIPLRGMSPSTYTCFSPDGRLVAASVTTARSYLGCGCRRERGVLGPLGSAGRVRAENRTLVSAGRATVGIWDLATGERSHAYPNPDGRALDMRFERRRFAA